MPQITTIIFDMYETLVRNPLNLWRESFTGIIAEQGLSVTADEVWEHWSKVDERFRNSRIEPGLPFQSYYGAWLEGFRQAFTTLASPGDPKAATDRFFADLSQREPYPETSKALALVQRDHRTAVLSNADDGFLLPNLGLLDVEFEQVLSSEKAQIYKPLPGLFQLMLDELGVTPDETAYVGDRQFEDVLGASRVGMHPVWINRDQRPLDPDLPKPVHQISSLLELPELLAADFS